MQKGMSALPPKATKQATLAALGLQQLNRRALVVRLLDPASLRRQTQSNYNNDHDQHHGDQNFH